MAEDQNIGAPGQGGPGPQPAAVPESAFPGPGPGAEPAAFGYAPDGGVPAPALPPWRRTRIRVITGIVVAVLAVLGFALQHLAATSPKGSVTLPGTLLGVSQDTGPTARAEDRTLVRHVVAGAQRRILHPVAGIYPESGTTGFLVVAGGACGSCAPRSGAAALRRYRARFPGARLFPPGPNGGNLVCANVPPQSTAFACWWADEMTGGYVVYAGGSASSFADAAAKTNQIRAAVEH